MNSGAVTIPMLVIDDDERYVDALFRDAQRHGIFLRHTASLEEGMDLLGRGEGKDLAGVILDVECYRRRDEEVPDSRFIIAATKFFTEKAPHLPLVAITGVQRLYDRYVSDFSGIWKVYRKGRDEGEMFAWLANKAGELDSVKVASRHPDIFRIVEKHLGGHVRFELVDCLLNLDSPSLTTIRGNLATLRSIQEAVYLALHRVRPDVIPRQYLFYRDKGHEIQSVNLAQILDHLKGSYDPRTQQNQGPVHLHYRSTLYRFSEMVYKAASDGIHAIDDDNPVKPTCYTVQAVAYALFDLILWFGRLAASKPAGVDRQSVPGV